MASCMIDVMSSACWDVLSHKSDAILDLEHIYRLFVSSRKTEAVP